jgi:hypothetical protein
MLEMAQAKSSTKTTQCFTFPSTDTILGSSFLDLLAKWRELEKGLVKGLIFNFLITNPLLALNRMMLEKGKLGIMITFWSVSHYFSP